VIDGVGTLHVLKIPITVCERRRRYDFSVIGGPPAERLSALIHIVKRPPFRALARNRLCPLRVVMRTRSYAASRAASESHSPSRRWCLQSGGKVEIASSSGAVQSKSCARLPADDAMAHCTIKLGGEKAFPSSDPTASRRRCVSESATRSKR
jgi:hypothetical protein